MYPKDIMPIIEKIELLRIRDKKWEFKINPVKINHIKKNKDMLRWEEWWQVEGLIYSWWFGILEWTDDSYDFIDENDKSKWLKVTKLDFAVVWDDVILHKRKIQEWNTIAIKYSTKYSVKLRKQFWVIEEIK
jgi:hypothetical protein